MKHRIVISFSGRRDLLLAHKPVSYTHLYLRAIQNHTITIGVGPAGTGKTYLAVAEAVTAFRQKKVNRIILTRPAVEAGERLGFLTGDLQNKVDPYLCLLYTSRCV